MLSFLLVSVNRKNTVSLASSSYTKIVTRAILACVLEVSVGFVNSSQMYFQCGWIILIGRTYKTGTQLQRKSEDSSKTTVRTTRSGCTTKFHSIVI